MPRVCCCSVVTPSTRENGDRMAWPAPNIDEAVGVATIARVDSARADSDNDRRMDAIASALCGFIRCRPGSSIAPDAELRKRRLF